MPDQIRYYFKETTNQILVSGSSTVAGMNALLTSSKDSNTAFDPNTTAKISALGTAVSYVVQNGTADGTVIPIADNQELWVYRGYQPVGTGDTNAYKYNPHLHRPYKAYILTETGSGAPIEPWSPTGLLYQGSYTTTSPPSTTTTNQFSQGYGARQLSINGNWNNQFANYQINVNAVSGSFIIYGEDRAVHPWVFTKYLSQNGSTIYGSEFKIWQEYYTSSFSGFTFNATPLPGYPEYEQLAVNNTNPISATTASIYSSIDNSPIFDQLEISIANNKPTWLEISSIATPTNFIRYQINSLEIFLNFFDSVEWWQANISNYTASVGFTPFTDGESINYAVSSSFPMGGVSQGQFYFPNQQPEIYPQITLTNGIYSYTSSIFDSETSTGGAASGSTQFGLYCDNDYYVRYRTDVDDSSANSVTVFFTGSNYTPEYLILQPGYYAIYTALAGSLAYSGAFTQATLSTTISATTAAGTTPQNIFSTRWNDVYISYSSSLSSSLDGLYIFNQLPQNDIQVTASMFLNAWTGSDPFGAKYGDADYGIDDYGVGEAGDGPTWPTASLRIYTGSYPNTVPNIGSTFVTESVFKDANIHVNGLAITMSYLIPSESIQLKDCLSIALAVTSSQNLNLISNSLVVSEYNLRFFTATQSREGDGRVPTFIENAFEGTLGFSNTPDCQPTLNNAYLSRTNPQIQEVDYSTNIYTPINFQNILSGSAQKSSVPASNYSSYGWTLNRYDGSRTQANDVNTTDGLAGSGYGELPVIDYKRVYFAYCDQVLDPYPILNNRTQFNIKYLINGAGDALSPLLSPYTAFDVEGTWDEGGSGSVAINQISGSSQYDQLNGLQQIVSVASAPQPILYSQTSSNAYTSFIPLDGNPNFISSFTQSFMQYSMKIGGSVYDPNNTNDQVIDYANVFAGITGSTGAFNSAQLSSSFANRWGQYLPVGGPLFQDQVAPTIILNTVNTNFPVAPANWTGSHYPLDAPPPTPVTNSAVTNPYFGNPGEIFFTRDPVAEQDDLGQNNLSDAYKIVVDYRQPSTLPERFRTVIGQPSSWGNPFGTSQQWGSSRVGEIQLAFETTTSTTLNAPNSAWTKIPFELIGRPTITVYFGDITSANQVRFSGQTLTLDAHNVSSDETFLGGATPYYRYGIFCDQIQNAIASSGGGSLGSVAYVQFNFKAQTTGNLQSGRRYRFRSYLYYSPQSQNVINNNGLKNYWNPNRVPYQGSGLAGDYGFAVPVNGPFVNLSVVSPNSEDNTQDNGLNSPFWEFSSSYSTVPLKFNYDNATSPSSFTAGQLLFNSTTPANITTAYMSVNDAVSVNTTPFKNQISTLANKGQLVVTNPSNPIQYFTGNITAVSGPSGTAPNQYFTYTLTPATVSATMFDNNIELEAILTTGSSKPNPVLDTLLLKDANGNLAYDSEYYIGYLPYKPGPNPAFPGGQEPSDTAWPRPNLEWKVEPNDEIRFLNNEGQSYQILDVTPPARNQEQTGEFKLKLKLNRKVPSGINIQFFLLRRYVYSPNTLISNNIFPYGSLPQLTKWVDTKNTAIQTYNTGSTGATFPSASSGQMTESASGSFISYIPPLRKQDNTPTGIVFPEYPIAAIQIAPDEILRDLRDKKLIT